LGTSLAQVTPIELHAEEATEFFIICEHDLSTFDKLLNNVLDFIGYDRIYMHISTTWEKPAYSSQQPIYTGCIKKKVIELQRAIVSELLCV
jgi:hypothetical protein